MQYIYDEEGLVEAIKHDGEVFELNDAQRSLIPGKRLPKTKSIQANLNSTVEDIKDSWAMRDAEDSESIIVDIEATHGGYFNKNWYHYLASGMKEMVGTWTNQGGRPYIVNHDMTSEPRGRVQDAKFVSTGDKTGFHALDVRIGHPDEIEMVIDGRALHVSVGSKPIDTVECRICGHDIFHDGHSPIRYQLDGEPSRSVMQKKAPGYFGSLLGMDNEDYWKVEEDEDGNFSALCRHVRSFDAPMGGDEEKTTGWLLHGQRYKEVSRVNIPADRNDDTGEFAHIREVLDRTSEMEDSAAEKYIAEELARVDRGSVQHARMNVAREKDLWRPPTPTEAAVWAEQKDYKAMFDTGLWNAIHAQHSEKSMGDQVQRYWESGGRFIDREQAFSEEQNTMSVQEALQCEDASEFGDWLRSQDFDRDEKRMLDKMYTNRYLRQRKQ